MKIGLKYVPHDEVCPADFKNYQSYEKIAAKKSTSYNKFYIKDPPGYCMAWSFFYMDLRLQFPKMSARELTTKSLNIISKEPEKLKSFIRGQMRFVESEVNKANKN